MSYDRKIKRRKRYVRPVRVQVLAPPIVVSGGLIWNLSPKVKGNKKRNVRPYKIQVLAPPIVVSGGLIWNLFLKVKDRKEKQARPKIQVVIPPPVVAGLIWNLQPKLGKLRQKREYTRAGKPQVLAPPIAIPGSLIYTLYPRVYDKKDRRRQQAYRGRIFIPIHSGAAAVIAKLVGSPYAAVDEIDSSAGGLSEITGAAYAAVDEVEGGPA